MEHGRESREHRHEQRAAFPPTQRAELVRQFDGNLEVGRRPSKGLHRGARPVGRDLEGRRRRRELLRPVCLLRLGLLRFAPAALKHGKVGELDFGFGQRGRLPLQERPIESGELAQEDVERPAVVNHVVLDLLQDVLLRPEPDQRPANEGQLREIEGFAEFFVERPAELAFPFTLRKILQVDYGERSGSGLMDLLDGSRLDRRKGGPIDLVPPHDFIEGSPKDVRIDASQEAKSRLKVIGAVVGLEALQEPDVLLRQRERDVSGARSPRDRHGAVAVLSLRARDPAGSFADRWRPEKLAERNLHLKSRSDPRHQLGGEERVPSELEEVVFDSDDFETEQFRVHFANSHFQRCLRTDERSIEVGRRGAGAEASGDRSFRSGSAEKHSERRRPKAPRARAISLDEASQAPRRGDGPFCATK